MRGISAVWAAPWAAFSLAAPPRQPPLFGYAGLGPPNGESPLLSGGFRERRASIAMQLRGGSDSVLTKAPPLSTKNGHSTPKTTASVEHKYANTRVKMDVGDTPLIDLSVLSPSPDVKIFGKCEFANPSGSIKDRIVEHILDEAERNGQLKPGGTIVAASSGNTAASVAMFAARRGYKAILITNKKTSIEKVSVLKAYGAEVILAPSGVPPSDPQHYQSIEASLCEENPSYFGLFQYDNLLNPEAYYRTLGPEIWEQTGGEVDFLVAAGSTGGTCSGTARYLKQMKPSFKCLLPDPHGSIFYQFWRNGEMVAPQSFQVEGVGKDSIPGAMDFGMVDMVQRVHDADAFSMCDRIASTQGVLVGGSAGANMWSAVQLAGALKGPATIVVILCDAGSKYLSKIYDPAWRAEKAPPLPADATAGPIYYRDTSMADVLKPEASAFVEEASLPYPAPPNVHGAA